MARETRTSRLAFSFLHSYIYIKYIGCAQGWVNKRSQTRTSYRSCLPLSRVVRVGVRGSH